MDELVAARTWGASREYLLVHPELQQPLGARDAQIETEIAEGLLREALVDAARLHHLRSEPEGAGLLPELDEGCRAYSESPELCLSRLDLGPPFNSLLGEWTGF
jgi:hypothetical protein